MAYIHDESFSLVAI